MQEHWSGLQCPPPGDLPHPGIEPASLMCPALAGGFFYHQRHLGSHVGVERVKTPPGGLLYFRSVSRNPALESSGPAAQRRPHRRVPAEGTGSPDCLAAEPSAASSLRSVHPPGLLLLLLPWIRNWQGAGSLEVRGQAVPEEPTCPRRTVAAAGSTAQSSLCSWASPLPTAAGAPGAQGPTWGKRCTGTLCSELTRVQDTR